MGKLGVVGLTVAAFWAASLLASTKAEAQDFGQSWIDRITHELEQERGPLQPRPFNVTGSAGVNYSFDNNIFLTNTGKKSDSIVTPFVQAGFTYGEPKFDVEANLLADYKVYVKEKADDDEERLFLRARQTASRWNFEISEIFQNVSDPAGLQFLNRVSRIVSTTIPKMAFDIGRSWTVEIGGNIQIVRYQEQPYSSQAENNNFSVDGALVYRTSMGFDVLAQFGYYNLNYITDQASGGTPDAWGYYYRVGYRGQLMERLTMEALIGWTTVESDFYISTGNASRDGNLSAVINLRYEASETVNFFLDLTRQYTFLGFGEPYQLLTSVVAYGKMDFTETFAMTLRLQYDRAESALDTTRQYYGAAVGANCKLTPNWIADGGVTYRGGSIENSANIKQKFSDFILSLGIAYGW